MPQQAQAPRVAINGFGRIGRLVTRALLEMDAPVDLVAVNDLADAKTLAHLFRYDSVHGKFPGRVDLDGDTLVLDGQRVRLLSEKDPAKLPWKDMNVDYAVESTGRFTNRADLQKHLDAGAKRVLLSAPGKDVDVTIVRGVNGDAFDPERHRIVSNASCTTNCLAPVLKALHDAFGVDSATMTTIHAYTNDQELLDSPHKDPRRARAAAISMIPTSTGAARAIGLVMPELDGKVDGMAVRVPIANGSVVDLTACLGRDVNEEDVVRALEDAANGDMQGILAVEHEPLVSVDYNHDPRSAIVDVPSLMITDGSLVKVLAWYDNEWAYSVRMAELVHDAWAHDGPATEEVAGARSGTPAAG